jgi:hypothetical protein
MQNIHTYYSQFQHLVQDTLQKGLGPIEKHLRVSNLAFRKKVLLLRKIVSWQQTVVQTTLMLSQDMRLLW